MRQREEPAEGHGEPPALQVVRRMSGIGCGGGSPPVNTASRFSRNAATPSWKSPSASSRPARPPRARAAPRTSSSRPRRAAASCARPRASASPRRARRPRALARELPRRRRPRRRSPSRASSARKPAAGRQPLERARRAEQPAHEPCAARVGDETDVDERGHEARRVGGDANVAGERERQPRAGGRAVHGCDHGLLERADREHVAVVVAAQVAGDVARARLELLQVLADAEAAPSAGDHDRADGRILRLLERREEPACTARVQRVQHIRAVQRDRQDAAVARDFDLGHAPTIDPVQTGRVSEMRTTTPSRISSSTARRSTSCG